MRYCIDLHSYCGRRFCVFFHPHSKTNGNRVINCEGSDWLVIQSDSRNLTSQATYCFFVFFVFFLSEKKNLKRKWNQRNHTLEPIKYLRSRTLGLNTSRVRIRPSYASPQVIFSNFKLYVYFFNSGTVNYPCIFSRIWRL